MTANYALPVLDALPSTLNAPVKKIYDGPDVESFLTSLAYRDIMTFIMQLNRSVVPESLPDREVKVFGLDDSATALPASIQSLQELVSRTDSFVVQAPPDTGPRRFGNVSFRKWFKLLEEHLDDVLQDLPLPPSKLALVELKAYFLGSFGSPQRLDYGTGHELSFLAFLACLWKIGYFTSQDTSPAEQMQISRLIVLSVFEIYLNLVRKLIQLYNLEPAGSHGVWGLDDNSFLPYVFGSAQLCPAINKTAGEPTPTSGSVGSAPPPDIVTKANLVEKEKSSNMYFSAIAFIYAVKRGPFWEHSPMLFDISGIKDGWGKINKGMIKMYHAEVLGKFPVVQHFPFGSLLSFDRDPEARAVPATTHTTNQPLRNPTTAGGDHNPPNSMRPPPGAAALGGAARPAGFVNGVTQAPWARSGAQERAPNRPPGFVNGATQAPWASRQSAGPTRSTPPTNQGQIQLNFEQKPIPEEK